MMRVRFVPVMGEDGGGGVCKVTHRSPSVFHRDAARARRQRGRSEGAPAPSADAPAAQSARLLWGTMCVRIALEGGRGGWGCF
jgi:hypothetical protein